MSQPQETSEDAITAEEMTGEAFPRQTSKPRNAFTELMSATKPHRPRSTKTPSGKTYAGRDGLLAYILEPESFPASRVISYDDDWVLIHDLYPKASVHLLLMPRNKRFYSQHPVEAFRDPTFLTAAKEETAKAERLAASELRRIYGPGSRAEQARIKAMEADEPPPPEELPEGRDWAAAILSGIHAHPSMSHLHIHIISEDRYSECLRHRKHYNSFATPFLVRLNEFPLSTNDPRRGKVNFLAHDMQCWRCGKNFENKFAALKRHLEEELQEWKKE
ncbi:aprataxin-like protein [Trichodelitschia bisporula]|uniref:Aprataxin-like protein n=1 Tax=Trichodelitschia bisporula TaxID=703511 RepID=A0A6G1HSI7_9PEZI|nr:aprataxin-like protein [Trichodelitschia bisporula]